MYVPHFNQMPDEEVRDFVATVGTAQLITVGDDGQPDATFLPVLWQDDRLLAHMARANQHWKRIADGAAALVVVSGPDAYVSPSWYASKQDHGKVVPTWNYSAVHLRGTVRVLQDTGWLDDQVRALTDHHERGLPEPWNVSDAPEKYVAAELRAIVGIEVQVAAVEAKAKLSQNRSEADRQGVMEALGDHPVADRMQAQEPIRARTS